MYVEEKDRAWTSGSGANDHRAVTIEVADNVIGGNWGSSAKAMAKLILLCADICRRNGIKRLNYTGNTKGNLTLHKWFQKTDCPGRYLESQMPTIASEVNKLLASGATSYTWKGATATGGSDGKLVIDGSWGNATTTKAQQVFKTTVDGIVSNQPSSNRKYVPNAYSGSWQFKSSGYKAGSQLIKAIQKMLKSAGYYTGAIDGWCGKQTVTAIQKFLEAKELYSDSIDGSMGPNTVKGWQKYINSRV